MSDVSEKRGHDRLKQEDVKMEESSAHTGTEDARSPTVAIETLMLPCTLDANEQKDMTTVNIPGAFMQADMDDEVVHLRPHGKLA